MIKEFREGIDIKVYKSSQYHEIKECCWVGKIAPHDIWRGKKFVNQSGGNRYIQIIPKEGLNNDYLYYLLQYVIFNTNVSENGKIKKENLGSKEVYIPSYEEQQEIISSKNPKAKIRNAWNKHMKGRSYDEKLHVDMDFDEILRALVKGDSDKKGKDR